ncbi:putative reverse transcriptase domain-containing protein, partial [Tanacetum coccineum]
MSSDEASSRVSYTSISIDYEVPSDAGSPGVVVYRYDRLRMHPVDPLSLNYVPCPEEPERSPLLPDYPYVAAASPTALSPGYIIDSDPEDGPMDYPADGGDDDDDSSGDDVDYVDEEEASKEASKEDEEEEEHLAPAESTAISPTVDPVPSAEETEPFETDESAATPPPPPAYQVTRLLAIPTPPPSSLTPLSSPLPRIPSPPIPVPSPPTTSPTYAEAPLGFRAAGIRLRAASPLSSPTSPPTHHPLPLPAPSTSRKADIPKADIPPQKRLCLIAPTPRFEVGESSIATVARQPGLGVARTTDYGFVDMVDDDPIRHVPREVEYDLYAHLEDAQDSQARLSDRVDILLKDRQFYQQTVMLIEDEALVSREAWAQAMGCSAAKMPPRKGTRTTPATTTATTLMTDAAIRALIARGVADALAERTIQRNTNLNGDGSQGSGSGITRPVRPTHEMESVFNISNCAVENQVKFATCTLYGIALTWWNTHVKTVGYDAAYSMPWKTLMKMITAKYCPRNEIKELEIEIWDLKVKGTDLASYTQRFQELALMCGRMFPEESDVVEKKQDDNFRSNQNQQQQNKRQNTGRAYTAGPSEKREYSGSVPKCSKCNDHHNGSCVPKCHKCNKVGHLAWDCSSSGNDNTGNNQRATGANQKGTGCYECNAQGHFKREFPKLKNKNHGNQGGNGNAPAKVYVVGNVG